MKRQYRKDSEKFPHKKRNNVMQQIKEEPEGEEEKEFENQFENNLRASERLMVEDLDATVEDRF